MKLVIVTPVSLRSAIARSTDLVVSALRDQGHEVVVVQAEHEQVPVAASFDLADGALAWTSTPEVIAELGAADAIVYELGDNAEFHEGCVKLMTTYPGIVVLHDFFLANLYSGFCHYHPEVTLDQLVEARYGVDVAAALPGVVAEGRFQSFMAAEAPMTEVAVEAARAAVCHAHWGTAQVLAACGGPVSVMALPYDADADERGESARPDGERGPVGGASPHGAKRTILTFGHVNPNKRARSVIRTIGADARLRDRWRYVLMGPISAEERAELTRLADDRGVELEIAGRVERSDLARAVHEADLVSCLRYPALEASSASAIEAMLHGSPMVVTDTGFYRELPDDLVVKIDPEHEVRDLHRLLLDFDEREPELRSRADAARSWARTTFDPDRYAQGLVDLAQRVRALEPAQAALTRIGRDLSGWGIAPDSALLGPVLTPLEPVWVSA